MSFRNSDDRFEDAGNRWYPAHHEEEDGDNRWHPTDEDDNDDFSINVETPLPVDRDDEPDVDHYQEQNDFAHDDDFTYDDDCDLWGEY